MLRTFVCELTPLQTNSVGLPNRRYRVAGTYPQRCDGGAGTEAEGRDSAAGKAINARRSVACGSEFECFNSCPRCNVQATPISEDPLQCTGNAVVRSSLLLICTHATLPSAIRKLSHDQRMQDIQRVHGTNATIAGPCDSCGGIDDGAHMQITDCHTAMRLLAGCLLSGSRCPGKFFSRCLHLIGRH